MSALLDALGYVGDSLAKPGRAVRGVLAGRMDEGLAALPFSDSLGITDPTRAVSGRDLLGQAGMATGNSWLDGLAGFGAEVATDPLTFLGAGLGTALGRAAGHVVGGEERRLRPRVPPEPRLQLGLGHLGRRPRCCHGRTSG